MTIADEKQNPRASKKLSKSLDAIAALRQAMEERLAAEHSPLMTSKALGSELVEPLLHEEAGTSLVDETSQLMEPASLPKLSASEVVQEEIPPSSSEQEVPPQKAKNLHETDRKSSRQDTPHGDYKTPPKMLDPGEWLRIVMRIAERSQRLVKEFVKRNEGLTTDLASFDAAHVSEAFLEFTNRILNNPDHFADAQLALWQGYISIWQTTLARFQGNPVPPVVAPSPSDKRFQDSDWQNVWVFDFLKQSYLLTAEWVHKLVHQEAEKLDPRLAHKLQFYTRQMVDAISPSNFWLTNPEVLRATVESGGDNLIKGLENLFDDLERGHGTLRISMSDDEAFEVGKNLAVTPGRVVYQNTLMQLIQYEARTQTVARVPMLIVPPWINKFYILDLREKNSMIRYLVEQGQTVFCISWVNPDMRHALTNFDDYVKDGIISAMTEIKRITHEPDINITGYCIGGTALACTLSLIAADTIAYNDLPRVLSASYLVTMIDFSQPGDLGVFIDEDQVKVLEARMAKQGYLDAATMATTFNMLRSNDLIWSFVVNNYLLGREPFPFDILYWNTDSTNLPAVMQSYYLRKMYIANKLIEPNGLYMKGVAIDLTRITTPSFLLSTHDDHIAPWRSTYVATQIYQAPITFVLAGSGHIAGVINPPSANKYGYWTNSNCPSDADDWLSNAEQHRGSWWPKWLEWLKSYGSDLVPARKITESIENAPGSYVKVKSI